MDPSETSFVARPLAHGLDELAVGQRDVGCHAFVVRLLLSTITSARGNLVIRRASGADLVLIAEPRCPVWLPGLAPRARQRALRRPWRPTRH